MAAAWFRRRCFLARSCSCMLAMIRLRRCSSRRFRSSAARPPSPSIVISGPGAVASTGVVVSSGVAAREGGDGRLTSLLFVSRLLL